MGGGASQASQNTQNQLTQQSLQLGEQQQAQSQEQYQQYKALTQPLIAQQTALASGSPQAATSALAPVLSQITKGYNASKEGIMSSMPAGAARDVALQQLQQNQFSALAGTQAQAVQQAPSVLAGVGSGAESFGLQQLGAALSGYSGASSSNQAVMQAQNEAKANQVGLVSGLAGMGGSVLGGYLGAPAKAASQVIKPITNYAFPESTMG